MATFRSTVELGGKTATGFDVPAEVLTELGARTKRPPVRVTINGHTYRSTIAVMGNRLLLPLSAEHRTAAGVAAGDEIDVRVEIDDEPRTVTVPPELASALAREADLEAAFDKLSYSHQRQHVLAIEAAKAPETRARRVAKTLEMLRAGTKPR